MRYTRCCFAWAPISLCFALFLAPLARAQSSAWVSTATRAVGPVLVNATPIGLLDSSTPIHVAVGLRLRNQNALVQYVRTANDPSSPLFGNWLTVSQFVAGYAPTSSQVQAVVSYLVLIRLAPLGTTACRSWVAAGSPVPEASGRRPSVFGGD
jgi:hypothetical protein